MTNSKTRSYTNLIVDLINQAYRLEERAFLAQKEYPPIAEDAAKRMKERREIRKKFTSLGLLPEVVRLVLKGIKYDVEN